MENLDLCFELINAKLEEREREFACNGDVYELTCIVELRRSIILFPKTADKFFSFQDFVKIAEACGCSACLSVRHNGCCATPCLKIY